MRRTAGREVELSLAARFGAVAGMDEVGRGALAGPVAVGVAVVDAGCCAPPEGLADSKMLTPRRRERLCEPLTRWLLGSAVGWADSREVDAHGIVVALRLAGRRALASVREAGLAPGVVLLDGSADWLSAPGWEKLGVPVVTRVRADATCAVVAAASVLAKVARDAWMRDVDDPGYDWARNKGYASPAHVQALSELGPSPLHRVSWHLPGAAPSPSMTPGASGSGMMVP